MTTLPVDIDFSKDPSASPTRMDKAMLHIDARLRGVEIATRSVDDVIAQIKALGLQRLNDALTPVYDQVVSIAQLGALFTTSSDTPLALALGTAAFTVAEADQNRFAAAAYLTARSISDPTAAMYGSLQAYDRSTGNLTLSVESFTGTAGDQYSDWRITAAASPDLIATAHAIGAYTQGEVDATFARILSPALIGAPTATTAAAGDNSTRISTTAFVAAAIAALVNGSPAALNTLKELADALGDDANFATTMVTALGNRLRVDAAGGYTSGQIAQALANLGLTDRQPGIGDMVVTLGSVAPAGCLKMNGALLNRVTFAPLWAWVQASAASIVSDATWAAGSTAAFSQGDGATTFRLPDYRGEFIRFFDDSRGLDGGRGLGSVQGQSIQSHAHTANGAAWYNLPGGFFVSNSSSGLYMLNGPVGTSATGDAETRPRNVSPLACIRYK